MPRRPSIFGTLVLLFTSTGFLIIGAVSLFLFRTFEQDQTREQRRALRSRLQQTMTELKSVADGGEALSEELDEIRRGIEMENATRRQSQFAIAIDRGRIPLLRAGPFPDDLRFPRPGNTIETSEVTRGESGDGNHYLLTSMRAPAGLDGVVVRLALDETQYEETLEHFRERTFVALFLGATLLALSAALVAQRAMQPIGKITAAAKKLDAGSLEHELEAQAWPAELQVLADEFSSMQRRLADSFRRLGQFSADLAHELRTPVNNLLGEAEVALRQPRSEGEYRDTLESMLEEIHRLRRMIEEMLFLARSEQPELTKHLVAVDARAEAESVVEFFSSLAEERGISIAVQGEARVCADRELLRRALSNLLANALQYSDRGASVLVRLDSDAVESTIAVSDTGSGIAAAHLPRLFDRFYRVDEARSRHPEGTGLGLSIVQSIASLHGGRVSVSSIPGAGTTFTIHLLRAEDDSSVI